MHVQVLAALIYIIDVTALIGAFAVVKLNKWLIMASIIIIFLGFAFFGLLAYVGESRNRPTVFLGLPDTSVRL